MKVENIKVTSRGRRAHVELEVTTDVPIESPRELEAVLRKAIERDPQPVG